MSLFNNPFDFAVFTSNLPPNIFFMGYFKLWCQADKVYETIPVSKGSKKLRSTILILNLR